MSWILKFWSSSPTPPATPVTWTYDSAHPPSDVPTQQAADITAYLSSIAIASPLAATRLNNYGQHVRFAYSAG